MSESPLVSICCITFNHAPFIRQCLDGFIMQKTNFPIEIIIHDDASTDDTANIIKEYEAKYPDIIKPIYQTENQYLKNISVLRNFVFPKINGKYMAICEGDDYWTDEYKLQKQFDFLEQNNDFSVCFHSVKLFDENKNMFVKNNTVPEVPDVTDIYYLAKNCNYINTLSVMYRVNKNIFFDLNNIPYNKVEDYSLHILHSQYGKIKKISDVMGVYRLHKDASFSTKSKKEQFWFWIRALSGLIIHFSNNNKVRIILEKQFRDCINALLIDFDYNYLNIEKELYYLKIIDDYISIKQKYERQIKSFSWRITKPLRVIFRYLKSIKIIYSFGKYLLYIKENGIKKAFNNIKYYFYMKFSIKVINNLKCKSDYQENIDFSAYNSKVKTLAFYLSQFHRIPENDRFWGDGFTEWTNTRKAKPRFKGHYQPREPHPDFDYYDLTNIETLKKQAELAKQHGIFGFCFYYYWFSGKRLLEKPLDMLLENPDIDINFCLCWANESWTRRFDSQENEILIQQNYSSEDPYKFIEDIKKYVDDDRYIKVNGIPVILVYNSENIPNIRNVFSSWKNHAKSIGIGEIKIWVCKTFNYKSKTIFLEDIIDSEIEFPPYDKSMPSIDNKNIFLLGKKAGIYDYKELVTNIINNLDNIDYDFIPSDELKTFRTCMLAWDNAARKRKDWVTFAGFSLKYFYNWVSSIINEAVITNKEFIFINSWNEWAEGTYLEPDKKYGYANINTFSKALFGIPFDESNKEELNL